MRTIPQMSRIKPETASIHDTAASASTSATWTLSTASGGLLRKSLSKTVLFPPCPGNCQLHLLS